MGKASSAKKVARAARAGSKKSSSARRQWGFPAVIGALIVAGVLLIVFLRGTSGTSSAENAFPSPFTATHPNGNHIHMAYGIDACGKFLPPIPTTPEGEGIHTHGDGVMHIHPSTTAASGKHAQLHVWLSNTGVQITAQQIVVPKTQAFGGTTLKAGAMCNGKPAVIRAAQWDSAIDSKGNATKKPPDKIYTNDFGKIWLGHDGGALTFYYGPANGQIPLPPASALKYLFEARGGNDQNVSPTPTPAAPQSAPAKPSPSTAAPQK